MPAHSEQAMEAEVSRAVQRQSISLAVSNGLIAVSCSC